MPRFRSAVLYRALPILLGCCGHAGAENTIDIVSAYVLRDVAGILSTHLDVLATYEAVPDDFRGIRRETEHLQIAYDELQSAEEVVRSIVDNYNEQTAGHFEVQAHDNVVHIIPTATAPQSASPMPFHSPLSAHIEIPSAAEARNYHEQLNEIARAVTNDSPNFYVTGLGLPGNGFFRSYGAEGWIGTAREALDALVQQWNRETAESGRRLHVTWWMAHAPYLNSGSDFKFELIVMITQESTNEPDKFYVERKPNILYVESKRPRLDAARILEKRLGVPVRYEDPPYEHRHDVFGREPRGGIVYVTWDSAEPAEQILSAHLSNAHSEGAGFAFELAESNDTFYLYPASWRPYDNDNELESVQLDPLMNTFIPELESDPDTCRKWLEEAIALTRSAHDVQFGLQEPDEPLKSFLEQIYVTPSRTNLRLRDVLDQIVETLGEGVGWDIIYHPATAEYELALRAR